MSLYKKSILLLVFFLIPLVCIHAADSVFTPSGFNLQNSAPQSSGGGFNLQDTTPKPTSVGSGGDFNLQNTVTKNTSWSNQRVTDIKGVVTFINSVLGALVPLIIGFALLFFLWGILVYIWNGEDEAKRSESKTFMLWGIIILFVMVSLWSLVSMVASSFNFHLPNGLVPGLPPTQK